MGPPSGPRLGMRSMRLPLTAPRLRVPQAPARRRLPCRAFDDGISLVDVLGGILKPEVAALISSMIAVGSVGLNMYGRILAESKRAELQKDLELERQVYVEQYELQSVMARYRGPLLEATIDLEQRITHLITKTEECCLSQGINEEEIDYTLFTVAQFLGFLEVLRREAPRERSYLGSGNPQGTDTLATLVEGIRFILCAFPATLSQWAAEGDSRDHPGYRERKLPSVPCRDGSRNGTTSGSRNGNTPAPSAIDHAYSNGTTSAAGGATTSSNGTSAFGAEANGARAGNGTREGAWCGSKGGVVGPDTGMSMWSSIDEAEGSYGVQGTCIMRVSRGAQRAIGSLMIKTPVGAKRHYTISYYEFYRRLKTDPEFSAWFGRMRDDILAFLSVPRWAGQPPFPVDPWTRLLLIQQVLMDTIEILDPEFVRFPEARRVRLAPIDYSPLPNAEEYKAKLMQLGRMMSQQGLATESLLSQDFGQEPQAPYMAAAPESYRVGVAKSTRLRNTLESRPTMSEW